GIAKSQTNSESTQAGTIKGKLSYLAPEYLEGLELDSRYDQFALGITLWEMLCSRKLFKENNDLAVLKKIQECKIPVPSSINPNVPKELDEIVLKALSKNRSKRFDNLDQMNRALMKFLYAKFPDFNATDLSYFAQELFRDEIKKDREKMFEFGKIDIKPFLEDMKRETERGSNATEATAGGNAVRSDDSPLIKKEAILDFGFDTGDAKKKNTVTMKKASVQAKDKTNSSEDNIISKRIADINDSTMTNIKRENGTTSKVNKEGTKILKVEKTETKKRGKSHKTSLGTYAALIAFLVGGGFYFYTSFLAQSEVAVAVTPVKLGIEKTRKPAQTSITQVEQAAGTAKIVLSHFDKQKMQVFIDGLKTEVDLLNTIMAPVGKLFTLRVQVEGRKHFIKEMNLANTSSIEEEIPEMPAIAYGYVYTANDCSAKGEVRFEIYGEKRVSPVPMKQEFGVAFPLGIDDKGMLAPATYELFYKKAGEEIERKIDVTIKREDQSIDLCEYL
ncbi:MAG: protein kinase, partial [Bacteriovorax sp.]|nr:protein kinase [Bacteriovorax sp.]